MKRFLILLLAMFVVGILPVLAGTSRQGGENLPTVTPYPVDNVVYDLTVVGGQDETFTFPGAEGEGITIGETTVNSNYPRGMEFTVSAESANGEVTNVVLFMIRPNESRERVEATWNDETNLWVARPWESGNGQPAWLHFDFFWRVTDASGAFTETLPQAMDYFDPTREWYRVETDYIIMYWFGFEETDPEFVAENITIAMAATEPRRIEGFGGALSYKPTGVVYPTREALGEIFGSGISNPNAAGWTSNDLGMTIQHISMPTDDWFERLQDCIYLTPREERTEAWRVNGMIYGTLPHEIAHLYQYDKGVAVGPQWWTEGQADYFTHSAGQYDLRLRHLGTLQTIPTLTGEVGWNTTEADGCYALAYDMGVSFINWLLATHGGLEMHAQLMQLLRQGTILDAALEQITGVSFFDLQNEWRFYLGLPVFSPADLDPALALEPIIEPGYAVGDEFTLGTSPRPSPLYINPGPNQISDAACFAGTTLTILRAGSLEGVNYYEVDCQGLVGWMSQEQLR